MEACPRCRCWLGGGPGRCGSGWCVVSLCCVLQAFVALTTIVFSCTLERAPDQECSRGEQVQAACAVVHALVSGGSRYREDCSWRGGASWWGFSKFSSTYRQRDFLNWTSGTCVTGTSCEPTFLKEGGDSAG